MTKCFDHIRNGMMKVFRKIAYTSKSPDQWSHDERQAMYWFFHNNFVLKSGDETLWNVVGDVVEHQSGVTFRKENRGGLTMVAPFEYSVPIKLARLILRRIDGDKSKVPHWIREPIDFSLLPPRAMDAASERKELPYQRTKVEEEQLYQFVMAVLAKQKIKGRYDPWFEFDGTYVHLYSGITIVKERNGLTVVCPFHYRIPTAAAKKIADLMGANLVKVINPSQGNLIRCDHSYELLHTNISREYPYMIEDVWHHHRWRDGNSYKRTNIPPKTIINEIPEDAIIFMGGWGSNLYFRTEEDRLAFILSH